MDDHRVYQALAKIFASILLLSIEKRPNGLPETQLEFEQEEICLAVI